MKPPLQIWYAEGTVTVQYPDGQQAHIPALEATRLISAIKNYFAASAVNTRPKFEWPKDPIWEEKIRAAGAEARRKEQVRIEKKTRTEKKARDDKKKTREVEAFLAELDL